MILTSILEHRKNIKHTNALRLVHRGEWDELDCTIDFYAGFLCVWIFDETISLELAQNKLNPLIEDLTKCYPIQGGVIKQTRKNPHNNQLIAEQILFGTQPPDSFEVEENGMKFKITLTQSQHTGLFLDQRDNRFFVKNNSSHKKVANLFSYTCSFSVAAGLGEACEVFSVDVSRPSLEIGKENFKINGLDESKYYFVKQDVRSWLDFQIKKNNQFDLIICDPPTFSKTKEGGFFSVSKEWSALVEKSASILSRKGTALFSTNHQSGKKEDYHSVLKKYFNSVKVLSPPDDFPVVKNQPETVRMYWCEV